MRIENLNAVITGGASGIGLAIAETLVARGCKVVIADINGDAAHAQSDRLGDNVLAQTCDVRSEASVAELVDTSWERLGSVDLVFANAGIGPGGPLLETPLSQLDLIYQINVRGSLATLVGFANRMIAEGRPGHLCVTGSEHSLGMPHAGIGHYTASKHAVLGFADVLRHELPETIRLTVLAPGVVSTSLHDSSQFEELPKRSEEEAQFAATIIGRGMEPAKVVEKLLRGMEDGDFLVPTHASILPASQRRAEEVAETLRKFNDLSEEEIARYDMPRLMQEVLGGT